MKNRDNKQCSIHCSILIVIALSVFALLNTVAVSALTDDGNVNYIRGTIKINGLPASQGTLFNVTVTSGSNVGYQYFGSVDDNNVPPFKYGNGYYATSDQVGFSTGDAFRVDSCGSSSIGTFLSGGNGDSTWTIDVVNINCSTSDTQPPVIALMSPNNNTVDYDGVVDFIYNVSDASGIDSCSLFINNSASAFSNNVQKNIPQTFSKNLTSGAYSWYVRCMDNSTNFNAGNSETRLLTVEISNDLTPPSITLLNPLNDAVLSNQNILFSYIVNDSLSGIQSCSLLIDSNVDQTALNVPEDAIQGFAKTLANGQYSWAVNCTDNSPNKNYNLSQTRTFTVNSTAQTAEINLTPVADSFIDQANPAVNYGSWPDLYLNPGTSSVNRIYFRWNISQIPANSSILQADIFMYGQSYSDSTTRIAEVHSVQDDSWNETGAGGINWNNAPLFNNSAESSSAIGMQNQWYNFSVLSSVVSEKTKEDNLYSVAVKYSNESDSNVWKRFRAREYAGASYRPYLRIVYGINPPSITQVNIPVNANEGSLLNISFTATDPENDIASYSIFRNGTLVSNTSNYIWQTDYQSAGNYLFEFKATDSTGLTATEQRLIQILNVPNAVINEFVSYPLLANETEWIELYNPTLQNKSLDGCYISNSGPIILNLSGYLNPLAFGVVDIPVSYLVNAGDQIRLKCSGILYDKVAYGDFNDGNALDNAPAALLGNSTGRISDGYDTDADINDFKIYSSPTKGYSNVDSVPPSITNVNVGFITNSTATVTWSTDENSNSTTNYGLSFSSLNFRISNNSLATMHNAPVANLQANTTYYYNVSSCDIAGNCASSSIFNFTTTANAQNLPPVLNPISNITVNEGQLINITAVASDANNDSLIFSVNDSRFVQTGSSQNGTIYYAQFTWMADFNSAGIFTAVVSVGDGQLTARQNSTVTVNNVNRAPILDLIGDSIIMQNQTLQFVVNASDPDGDSLTYGASGLPQGVFLNSTSGAFSWTPTFNQSGNYSVIFNVSDGNLIDLESIVINVNKFNVAPAINSYLPLNSTVVIDEGQNQTFAINASDLNGDNLTFVWELNGNSVSTGTSFTFYSNFNSSSSNNVTVTVSDGELNASKAWNLIVNNVDRAPVLQFIGDKAVAENESLQFVVNASDADGDVVYYSVSNLPVGAVFDNATRTFSWTPDFNQSGNYSVAFVASDGFLTAAETINISVANVDRIPSIDLYGPLSDPTTNENQTIFFYISASDPDSDLLSTYWYLDGNLSFIGNATSTYAYIPDFNSAGVHTVNGIVSDGTFNVSKAWNLTVNDVDRAPVLQFIGDKVIAENESLQFVVNASDADGDVVYYSVSNLPVGAVFDNATRTFTWIPDFNQSGNYSVAFVASDSVANATQTIVISVTDFNQIPSIISTSPAGISSTITEEQSQLFSVVAADPDNDALSYMWLLNGTPVSTASNYTFVGNYSSAGVYTVKVEVSDVKSNNTYQWALNVVNVDRAPVILSYSPSAGSVTMNENNSQQFDVNVSDPDGDSIAVNWSVDGVLNSNENNFNYSTGFDSAGNHSISASTGNVSRSWSLTVNNVDRAPVLQFIGDKSVLENQTLQFVVNASDADGDIIQYSAVNLPAGAVFDNATRTFTWIPDFNQSGNYSVAFVAGDGVANATQTILITVNNLNQVPSIDSFGPLNNSVTITEEQSQLFSVVAVDADNDVLNYKWSLNGTTMSVAENYTFVGNYSSAGVYTVKVEVSDGKSNNTYQWALNVVNVDRAPVILSYSPSAGSVTMNENNSQQFDVNVSDPDGDSIAVNWSVDGVLNSNENNFNYSTGFDSAGNHSISASTGNVSRQWNVSVANLNRAPAVQPIGDKSVAENQTLQFVVNAVDADNDAILYSASNLPQNAVFDAATRTFTWTPNFAQNGIYQTMFSASDGNLTASTTITITVANVNRQPKLQLIGNKQTIENQTLQFVINATDLDGDNLFYSTAGMPQGAQFNNLNNQQFVWTPSFTQSGNYNATFSVSDGSLVDSETVQISVIDSGDHAPTLAPIGNKTITEGQTIKFMVNATDIDGDNLVYSASGLPTGAIFNLSSREFSWTPSFTQSGNYFVTFVASDGTLSASETPRIVVLDSGNHAPLLNDVGSKSVAENQTLQFTVNASDADGDIIQYSAVNLPAGAQFAGQQFTWVPSFSQSGIYYVTFIASDGVLSDNKIAAITVTETGNHAPVLVQIGNKAVVENQTLQFTVSAVDADFDNLTYTASGLPSGAQFSSQKFTWIPSFTQSGNYLVTFTVNDGKANAIETINVAVVDSGNHAPVLDSSNLGNQQVLEGELLQFTLSASDIDGDNLSYSVSGLPSGASFNSASKIFSWTPSFTQSGNYQTTFTVRDGILSDSRTVQISVLESGNHAPSISMSDKSIYENQTLQFAVTASDADGDVVAVSASRLPSGAQFSSEQNSGQFIWTPNFAQAGDYFVWFNASDGKLSTTATVKITVFNTDRTPIIISAPLTAVVAEQKYTYQIVASDPDNDSLKCSIVAGPTGLSVDRNTCLLAWVPSVDDEGSNSIIIQVSDGQLVGLQAFSIEVSLPEEVSTAKEKIQLSNVELLDSCVEPGTQLRIAAGFENTGKQPMKAEIVAVSQDIAVRSKLGPFAVKPGSKAHKVIALDIPENAKSGVYDLKVIVRDESSGFERAKYREFEVGENCQKK